MKKLIILTLLMLTAVFLFADIIVGTGTSTGRYPFDDYYVYSKSQCIYLASEINCASGTITHLQWYRSDTGADPNAIGTTEIWLTETTSTTLSTWQPEGTLVATISNIDLGSGGGWYDVDITDFAYNGGNLMVSVRTQNAPYTSPHSYWYYTSTSAYRSLLGNSDSVNPPSVSTSYYRPNIKLVGINVSVYPEPTNHVTGFAAGTLGYTSIQLNWTGATGAQLPGNYLIQAIKGAGSYATVADGTPVADDAVWTDNNAAINVAHVVGANSYTFTGLSPLTAYQFKIWPYTNSGANINFKTDGTIPTVNASTLDPSITSYPYTQNFGTTGAAFPPANWNKYSGILANPTTLGATGTGSWYQRNWRNVTETPVNYAGVINIYGTSNGWLISPPIAVPGNDYELKFDLSLNDYYTSNSITSDPNGTTGTDDVFAVLIGDGTSWTPANVVRQWDNAGSTYVYNNISYLGETVILPLGSAGTKYVAFYGCSTVSNADNDLFVDNIIFRQTPASAIFGLVPDVTSWDFGMAAVNIAKTKVFTINNTGGAPLTLTSVTTTGTYYSISVPPALMTIPAGGSTTFTVQYLPTVVGGPYTGSLDIVFGRETRTVSLSGSAYAPATLPITEGFEAGFGTWVVQNGTQVNQWTVGTATYNTGTQSAYITNDAGVSNAYDVASTSVVHFYKDIAFAAGAERYNLTFNWKGYGESSSYDYLQVFLVDTTVDPVAGTRITTGQIGTNYNLQSTWQSAAIQIPNTVGGSVKRLVFSWWNDSSVGTQPPIAVDDISLVAVMPSAPDVVTLSSPTDGQTGLPVGGFDLTWTPALTGGTPTLYGVYMSQDEANIYSDIYFERPLHIEMDKKYM